MSDDQLIESQIPYARGLAGMMCRHLRGVIAPDELQSVAYLALVSCAARYDASLGTSFRTYLYRRVTGAMLDYARDEDPRSRYQWRRDGVSRPTVQFADEDADVGLKLSGLRSRESSPEHAAMIAQAVDTLACYATKPMRRMVMQLKYRDGCTESEIAARTGFEASHIGTVAAGELEKIRSHLGMATLRPRRQLGRRGTVKAASARAER